MPNTNHPNTPPTPGDQPPSQADALREHLGRAYEPRARTSKYFSGVRPFAVANATDDRWEWSVSVAVIDADPPRLGLILHGLPYDLSLVRFASGLGGRVIPYEENATYVIELLSDDTTTIRRLAGTVRAVVSVRWPWLTTKVADALSRLAAHLDTLPDAP